ncbi:hypothetical protein [Daejeonella sp.]|uniref:hypothetical protein n=1 Tax=Daejeonella sp. TaxID=2805397 RepID=UPI00272FB87E|nr:hypothetical protein [Daejeonella sp.]MDP2415620.1 hypothetical protein [Daejeonella sp.]
MKVLLSFILFIFIAAEIKAQVASSSLYIKLSDIQSVQIIELPLHSSAVFSEKKSGKGDISILNPSSSQIRKFESQTENTELEFQQNNKGSQMEIPASIFAGSGTNMQTANLSQRSNRSVPLVLYQIDPR